MKIIYSIIVVIICILNLGSRSYAFSMNSISCLSGCESGIGKWGCRSQKQSRKCVKICEDGYKRSCVV